MSELHHWLSAQHPGLRTYRAFQEKTFELANADVDHRALYRLLFSIVDPYIEKFDEQPLPVDLAKTTFDKLLDIVHDAEESISLAPAKQIDVLNKIAATVLV